MEDKLRDTDTYPKWMLINEDKVGSHDAIKSSTFPFNILYSLATNQQQGHYNKIYKSNDYDSNTSELTLASNETKKQRKFIRSFF